MEELLAAYKREGIDPTPYYWFTDQRKYGSYGSGVEVCYTALWLYGAQTFSILC